MADYDDAALVNGMEDYFVMLENSTSWYSFCGGKGTAIDEEKRTELRRVYDATQTYVQGVEDYLNAAAAYFPVMDTPMLPSVGERLVFDAANLLTEEQADELNRKLLEVSHQYQAQIFIHTLPSVNGHDIDVYVEYLYDSMGMGYGSKHDGVLLLVSMDPREYRILSNGFAGDAITTDDIDSIGELIRPHLSDGEYVEAFDIFVEQCRYYIDGHLNGFPFNKGMSLVISLAIGIVVGLIVAKILKGQLKSVRQQHQANNYMKPGSLNITNQNEFFLYSHVSRTPRSKDDSSSGSGSSSGSSRSVGGGSF